MVRRGDKFVNTETGEKIIFHHHRPLSYWSSFRAEEDMSERIHLPPAEVLHIVSDWVPDESS